MYHLCVPGTFWLQVTRNGIPQLVCTDPLRTGTVVHVFFLLCCFLPSRGFSCGSLFCDHGLDFRKMSYGVNIVITIISVIGAVDFMQSCLNSFEMCVLATIDSSGSTLCLFRGRSSVQRECHESL